MLADQHGACSWAEHDAHADSLAAVAATGAEEAEAEKNENDEKAKARVRDRKRREKAKAEKAALLPRAWQQEAVDAFRAHVRSNIVHGRGNLKRMAASLPVSVPNRKRICRRGR